MKQKQKQTYVVTKIKKRCSAEKLIRSNYNAGKNRKRGRERERAKERNLEKDTSSKNPRIIEIIERRFETVSSRSPNP